MGRTSVGDADGMPVGDADRITGSFVVGSAVCGDACASTSAHVHVCVRVRARVCACVRGRACECRGAVCLYGCYILVHLLTVGSADGSVVTAADGGSVGLADGSGVSGRVGRTVGTGVGSCDGTSVGKLDGYTYTTDVTR